MSTKIQNTQELAWKKAKHSLLCSTPIIPGAYDRGRRQFLCMHCGGNVVMDIWTREYACLACGREIQLGGTTKNER